MSLAVLTLAPAVMEELGTVSLTSWQVIAGAILAALDLPPGGRPTVAPETGVHSLILDLVTVPPAQVDRCVEALAGLFDMAQLTERQWRIAIPNGHQATAPDRTCIECKQPALTHDGDGGVYCTDCGAD